MDKNAIWSYIAGAVTALVGIFVNNWLTNRGRVNKEKEIAYQKLMGFKAIIKQLDYSRAEAKIQSDYHEILWRKNGNSPESINLQEAIKKQDASELYTRELGREKQKLFETLATVAVLFRDEKIDKAIKHIYNMKFQTSELPSEALTMNQLNDWLIETLRNAKNLSESRCVLPLQRAINLIEKKL